MTDKRLREIARYMARLELRLNAMESVLIYRASDIRQDDIDRDFKRLEAMSLPELEQKIFRLFSPNP
jgi:hypothetical protein